MNTNEMTLEQQEGYVRGLQEAFDKAQALRQEKRGAGNEISDAEINALMNQYAELLNAQKALETRRRAQRHSLYARF